MKRSLICTIFLLTLMCLASSTSLPQAQISTPLPPSDQRKSIQGNANAPLNGNAATSLNNTAGGQTQADASPTPSPSPSLTDTTLVRFSKDGVELQGFSQNIIWFISFFLLLGTVLYAVYRFRRPEKEGKEPSYVLRNFAIFLSIVSGIALLLVVGYAWGRSSAHSDLQKIIASNSVPQSDIQTFLTQMRNSAPTPTPIQSVALTPTPAVTATPASSPQSTPVDSVNTVLIPTWDFSWKIFFLLILLMILIGFIAYTFMQLRSRSAKDDSERLEVRHYSEKLERLEMIIADRMERALKRQSDDFRANMSEFHAQVISLINRPNPRGRKALPSTDE